MKKKPLETKQVKPHQLGWLRLSDQESEDMKRRDLQCWELPCGRKTITEGEPKLFVLKGKLR